MTYKVTNYGQWGRMTEPGSHRMSSINDQGVIEGLNTLYRGMGIPANQEVRLIVEEGASLGQEWADLTINSIGVRMPDEVGPYPWPSWTTETKQEGKHVYQLWDQHLTIKGSEVTALIEWRPTRQLWVEFQDVEKARSEADIVRLYRAVERVKAATRRGRNKGQPEGEITTEIKAQIVENVKKWRCEEPKRKWSWIAKKISEKYSAVRYSHSLSERTLRRWHDEETSIGVNRP